MTGLSVFSGKQWCKTFELRNRRTTLKNDPLFPKIENKSRLSSHTATSKETSNKHYYSNLNSSIMNLSIVESSTHRSYCDKDGVWHSTGIVGATWREILTARLLETLKQQEQDDDTLYGEEIDVDEMKITKAETKAGRAQKKFFQSSKNKPPAPGDSKDKRREKRKASRIAKYMANRRGETKIKDKAQHSRRMERMSTRVVNME